MKYRVILNERAEQQLEASYQWWSEHRSHEQATRWYDGFIAALRRLGKNPKSHGRGHESQRFPYDVRELRFGLGGKSTHR